MVAFPGADEGKDAEEIAAPTRRFTLAEITSGVPDDSREEDEREEARRLRDLRGRVKRARAVVATTPGLAKMLAGDRQGPARFYAKSGINEVMLWDEIPTESASSSDGLVTPVGRDRHPEVAEGLDVSPKLDIERPLQRDWFSSVSKGLRCSAR